jgi:hypothetical protein
VGEGNTCSRLVARRGGDGVNHEYRIKRIRNIIKRFEEKEGSNIGDWCDAWERIKEQVEVKA